MPGADLSGLVRAGSAVRALRIIPVTGPKAGEPVEESGVFVPSGLIIGDYVGVGGLAGFAFRFGRGACLDFAGEQVYAPEDVADEGGQTPATITADLQSCGPGTVPSGVISVLGIMRSARPPDHPSPARTG